MRFLNISLLCGMVICLLSSCDDDDNYSPGPEAGENCPVVYFSADNETTIIFRSASDVRSVDIVVKRLYAEGALQVPVDVVSSDPGLTIQQLASFGDGEDSAVITVTAPDDMALSQRYNFSLSLPDEYVDPYRKVDGAGQFSGSVVLVESEIVKCCFYYAFDKTGGYFDQEAMRMSDTEILFPDFMDSGFEVTAKIDPVSNYVTLESEIGYYDMGYDDYVIEYPLYPGNGQAQTWVDYTYVYYGGYSMWFSGSYEGFYLNSYCYFGDGTEAWEYIYFYFGGNYPE